METQNHPDGEFDEMSQKELAGFKLADNTEAKEQSVLERAERYAETVKSQQEAQELGYDVADEVIMKSAEEEAAREEGREEIFRKLESTKLDLAVLQDKLDDLQKQLQQAEEYVLQSRKAYKEWQESGNFLKRLSHRLRGDADLQKKITLAEEKLAATEYDLEETNQNYKEQLALIEALKKL